MNDYNEKLLSFSEDFIQIKLINSSDKYLVHRPSIILNAGNKPILTGGQLGLWKSGIFNSITLNGPTKFIQISMDSEFYSEKSFYKAEEIRKSWSHVYDIFRLEHLKTTNLWRSKKEKVDNIEFNLWFASAGTNCGIHNEHNFRELHTQIFGIGRMQKFLQNDINTLYEDAFMSPGFTHSPFYDDQGIYPWHQYKADTDCIWLAIEFYD